MLKSHRSATTWRSEPEGLEDFKHLVTGPGRFAVTTSYREDLVHPGITFGSGFEKDRRPKIISGGIHRLAAMDLLEDMSGSVPEPSVRHFDEIALVCLKYKADVECPDMIWPH